jgi:hypothetical protein
MQRNLFQKENTMRRLIFGFVTMVLLADFAWAGGDPWKSKPFGQWDEKDVRRILTDSPWSRPIQVHAPWKMDTSTASLGQSTSANQSRPMGTLGGGASAGPVIDPTQQIPLAAFIVRWLSARTMREAALRGAVLAGQMKQEDAEKQAAQAPGVYQVLVAGPDMSPFEGADEKALKEGAFLLTKKSKQKIPAGSVELQKAPDGKKVLAAVFSFPMKTTGGESSIAADEKAVDFSCSVGGAKIQIPFDLSKMEDKQGRDL